MSDDAGLVPIAYFLSGLWDELRMAQTRQGAQQFTVGAVQVELAVVASLEGGGRLRFWVNSGGDATIQRSATQKVILTLTPVERDEGHPVKVSSQDWPEGGRP